jgi:hypothetical protein
MDIKAFTDDRANDTEALTAGEGYLFTADNSTLTVTDDSIAARRVESEIMTIGLNLSANYGKFVPFLGFSYESESTTSAAYKTELGTDVAVGATVGNIPTIAAYWEKMAAAGAEGGSIGSMSDTNIAVSPTDAAIIMYNTSNSKWEDNQVFGTNRAALQLDGGTF